MADGLDGLRERPRAPKSCPHRMESRVADALLEARRRHPRWGPRKLLAYLSRREPSWSWPAPSTVGDLLKRHGLVTPRRRRRRRPHPGRAQAEASRPNALWSLDFKGEFRTGDQQICYPLTVADRYSRFLLGCKGLPSTSTAGARGKLERMFRDYGHPRCDPQRQRDSVQLDGPGWVVATFRLVDQAGDRAAADRAGASGAEWLA